MKASFYRLLPGCNELQVLSDQITDVAGLDYNYKRAYKIGNQVFITMRCKNGSGATITSASTLFTLGASLKPGLALYLIANIDNHTIAPVNIAVSGEVSLLTDLTKDSYVTFAFCYSVY